MSTVCVCVCVCVNVYVHSASSIHTHTHAVFVYALCKLETWVRFPVVVYPILFSPAYPERIHLKTSFSIGTCTSSFYILSSSLAAKEIQEVSNLFIKDQVHASCYPHSAHNTNKEEEGWSFQGQPLPQEGGNGSYQRVSCQRRPQEEGRGTGGLEVVGRRASPGGHQVEDT